MSRVKCYAIALVLLCISLMVASNLAQSCGKRKVVNFLVVNGTAAKEGYWPWHAAIFHNNGRTFVYACGGTILNQNTVLTAAHCVTTPSGILAKRRLVVHVGRNRLSVASKRVQEHEAFELIIHPKYNVNSIQHDVALIMLATDITYTDYIQPVCLWNRGEDIYPIVGTKGTVVGFGIDETDDVSDALREANIPVVSHITCIESNREVFANQLTSNMFCAGNRDGISACNGDSGGGLFINYSDTWFIRGVVSFTKPRQYGINCDSKEYTVFTDVAKYLRWIEQHVRGSGGQTVVIGKDNNRKIDLLPMSTCGPNRYASRKESSKSVLLGYPWMGLVECTQKRSFERKIFSQATLISDLYLVTAAYYVIGLVSRCFVPTVRLGDYDLNTTIDCAEVDGERVCSPPVQILRIESIIRHPDFNKPRNANDIALIRLRDRADTNWSNVKPICLPVTSELRSQKPTHYTLTGWPIDSDGNLLARWQREFIDSIECQKFFDLMVITTNQKCLKKQQDSQCKNTFTGAPLQLVQQVQGESRYVLYGVISLRTRECLERVPDVYTNVASYVDWILENIQE